MKFTLAWFHCGRQPSSISWGKLPLPESPETYVPAMRQQHQIASLSLDETSVSRLAGLPLLHRDPFDRMLICQTLAYGLVLVTVDETIAGYSAPVLGLP